MANFDEILKSTSERVLKRPLSEAERIEILELAGILGMKNVQDYLYMILTFKYHEDRLSSKLDAMTEISGKIETTLRESTENILTKTASDIADNMAKNISEESSKVISSIQDYEKLRGMILLVCLMSFTTSTGFWLGTLQASASGFMETSNGFLKGMLGLPCGWSLIFCFVSYSFLWSLENWKTVQRSFKHKIILIFQLLLTVLIFSLML